MLLVPVLELIPLAALAALVMVVGVQMVSITHIRNVTRHREVAGVRGDHGAAWCSSACSRAWRSAIAVAVAVALHRLTRTRITHERSADGGHRVRVRGQLTFLAVPRLSRMLGQVPARGGRRRRAGRLLHGPRGVRDAARLADRAHRAGRTRSSSPAGAGRRIAEPATAHQLPPLDALAQPPVHPADRGPRRAPHPGAINCQRRQRKFQRNTAPLVRDELARLAREGQRPSQLFLTCADSRLVTSMITSSGPGDLFTVRNVGNLVPPPGERERWTTRWRRPSSTRWRCCEVESITVCGHSGCGAMQALHHAPAPGRTGDAGEAPLGRWLRHGRPSLERAADGRGAARAAARGPRRRPTTSKRSA